MLYYVHVVGRSFSLWAPGAVYYCGFSRLGNDCIICAVLVTCVIAVLYCTVLMVLPVVLYTYIVYVL